MFKHTKNDDQQNAKLCHDYKKSFRFRAFDHFCLVDGRNNILKSPFHPNLIIWFN